MKCVICRSTDIATKTVDEQIRCGQDIVLVRMNLKVCSACGERYYDKDAMKKIEQIRSRLAVKQLEVKEIGKVFRAHAA